MTLASFASPLSGLAVDPSAPAGSPSVFVAAGSAASAALPPGATSPAGADTQPLFSPPNGAPVAGVAALPWLGAPGAGWLAVAAGGDVYLLSGAFGLSPAIVATLSSSDVAASLGLAYASFAPRSISGDAISRSLLIVDSASNAVLRWAFGAAAAPAAPKAVSIVAWSGVAPAASSTPARRRSLSSSVPPPPPVPAAAASTTAALLLRGAVFSGASVDPSTGNFFVSDTSPGGFGLYNATSGTSLWPGVLTSPTSFAFGVPLASPSASSPFASAGFLISNGSCVFVVCPPSYGALAVVGCGISPAPGFGAVTFGDAAGSSALVASGSGVSSTSVPAARRRRPPRRPSWPLQRQQPRPAQQHRPPPLPPPRRWCSS